MRTGKFSKEQIIGFLRQAVVNKPGSKSNSMTGYGRLSGLPFEQQPWLASVWRKPMI